MVALKLIQDVNESASSAEYGISGLLSPWTKQAGSEVSANSAYDMKAKNAQICFDEDPHHPRQNLHA